LFFAAKELLLDFAEKGIAIFRFLRLEELVLELQVNLCCVFHQKLVKGYLSRVR
jgi:hypothetical protein